MAILVTGGAGFIGSHLVEKLLDIGKRVVCLDNFNDFYDPEIKRGNIKPYLDNSNFKLVEADILDTGLEKTLKGEEIKTIVHLAAMAGVRPSIQNPQIYIDVNVKGTVNILEAARTLDIKNFVFGSSSSVYGLCKPPFREESSKCSPISPYGASKLAGETLCQTYSHLYGLHTTCLRFFTVYGPRQRPEMAIHKFTRLIDQGRPIEMFGDGSSQRDYTYVSDIVGGIMGAIEMESRFEVFNLGESKTVKLSYMISLIEKFLGKKAKIKGLPDQAGDVLTTCADIDKAKKMIGYNPCVGIEDGIRMFVEWYRTI